MFSQIALKVYCGIKQGKIKSNADFWKNFSCLEAIENLQIDTKEDENCLKANSLNLVCIFDENFPKICGNIKQTERPFLFVYRGDINLLNDISNNIAVIGVKEPTKEITNREEKIVQQLVANEKIIVSGLALGCDSIAHNIAVGKNAKTIAFLPSTLLKIYPFQNIKLAEGIIANGGLVVSEYVSEAKDRFGSIRRFIERDRLQAMFSSAIILIASFRHGEGDCGSRHAMQKAKEYGNRKRFVMFNEAEDENVSMFGLNRDLLQEQDVKILTKISIKGLF